MTSILTFLTDLTGGRRKRYAKEAAAKSPEQKQFEALLSTPTVQRKNVATPEEIEKKVRVKATTPIPVGEALKGVDYILLYYSASWCPPCRRFTPELAEFADRNKDTTGKTFQVVLVSWDNNWRDFANYFKKMPQNWFAIPPTAHSSQHDPVKILNHKHGIRSIPAIVVIDAKTNKVVSKDGRMFVGQDYHGAMFPWDEESMANSRYFGMGKYLPTFLTSTAVAAGSDGGAVGSSSSSSLSLSSDFLSFENVARFSLTCGGGLCGLFVYKNMRNRVVWEAWKGKWADRIQRAAESGGRRH